MDDELMVDRFSIILRELFARKLWLEKCIKNIMFLKVKRFCQFRFFKEKLNLNFWSEALLYQINLFLLPSWAWWRPDSCVSGSVDMVYKKLYQKILSFEKVTTILKKCLFLVRRFLRFGQNSVLSLTRQLIYFLINNIRGMLLRELG